MNNSYCHPDPDSRVKNIRIAGSIGISSNESCWKRSFFFMADESSFQRKKLIKSVARARCPSLRVGRLPPLLFNYPRSKRRHFFYSMHGSFGFGKVYPKISIRGLAFVLKDPLEMNEPQTLWEVIMFVYAYGPSGRSSDQWGRSSTMERTMSTSLVLRKLQVLVILLLMKVFSLAQAQVDGV